MVEKKEKKSDNKSQEVLRKNFPFKEKTKAYGLENITANNINIVDLNTDGYSDIVIIPTYYAEPDFYYFNPNTIKRERYEQKAVTEKRLKPEDVRNASGFGYTTEAYQMYGKLMYKREDVENFINAHKLPSPQEALGYDS